MTPQELFTKSLMNYDKGEGSHDMFYYNLPYIRNYDLCNWHPHGMYSGNVVKFYQYNLDKPVVLFTDTDDMDSSDESEIPENSASLELSDQDYDSNSDFEEGDDFESDQESSFENAEETSDFESFADKDLEMIDDFDE